MINSGAIVPTGHASPVKGVSHEGKKITVANLSHGLPVCRPSGKKLDSCHYLGYSAFRSKTHRK